MAEAKDFLICLDDGHGQETPGKRTPHIPGIGVIKENTFNSAVVRYLNQELKRYGFRTLLVAPSDADTPLATRVSTANDQKGDLYVSCHYNSGGGSGVETYYFKGRTEGKKLAEKVHKYVIQGTRQRNRGIKTANFYVLRMTKMPAVLVEYGFMDDPGLVEAKRMINPEFQQECAVETAMGICEYFNVPYVPKNEQPDEVDSFVSIKFNGEVILDTEVKETFLNKLSQLWDELNDHQDKIEIGFREQES